MTPQDFVKYGYTVGCPGCEQLQLQLDQRRGHTEECRKRIEEEIAKTAEGKARIARATGRIDHKTAALGQEEMDKETTKSADVDENLQDMPPKTSEVSRQQLPTPAPAVAPLPEIIRRQRQTRAEAEESTHQRGSSSTDVPMGLAGPEFFNMDSSPRRDSQRRGIEERESPDPPDKRMRPRSPTATLDSEIASDIANDDSGMLDGLSSEDKRILSSVILG